MARIIFLIAFCIIGISLFYFSSKPKQEPLPIYNPIDLDPEVVDSELLRIGRGHTIGAFEFQNQEGKKLPKKMLQVKCT